MGIVQKCLRIVLTLIAVAAASSVLAQNFVTVDYPGQVVLTEVREINNLGEMAGRYIDTNNVIHAFTLNRGAFTNIDVPGAAGSAAWGINDNGDVVGRYYDPAAGRDHGFLLHNGTYTIIDPPGTTETFALGINNLGQIVGYYVDTAGTEHGFLFSNGTYTTIDFPGSTLTNVEKTNNFGTAVGSYLDANFNEHGFQLQNGMFTSIDVPGAIYTEARGLNNGGQIVGGYGTTSTNEFGFELSNGSFQTINFVAATGGILVEDLNDQEQAVGIYLDSAGIGHGFVTAKGPFFYATNPAGNNVLVVDSATDLQLTAIPVGPITGWLAASPDQKQLYVSNNGNQVAVIDTASNTVLQNIPVGNGPVGMAFTPDGVFAYVANISDNTVSVVDTVKQSAVFTVTAVSRPFGVAITPDGKSVYVTDAGANGGVTVISTATNSVTAVIPGIVHPQGVTVSPDGAFVYVPSVNAPSGSAVVISTATNTIVATIPLGNGPVNTAFSPDGSTAYVDNQTDSTISIIDTATKTVTSTISAGTGGTPGWVVTSPDGSSLYVLDLNSIDVISTASNSVTATIPAPSIWLGAAVFLTAAPTAQTITQPLSPTAQNVFNFGPHAYKNQYPAGTSFSGVTMNVTAQQLTQAQFKSLVAGSAFNNASCIAYAGQGGNCVDYEVSCTDSNNNPIACPSTAAPQIDVTTAFDTQQSIINPGFLRRPTGSNQFQNIFTSFAEQRVDPTVKGRTTGFSDFIAVDLGAGNSQGASNLSFLSPLRATDPRAFHVGSEIEVRFSLTSIANPSIYVTDAQAGLSIVMVADANGNPLVQEILTLPPPAFRYSGEENSYRREFEFEDYAPGTYVMTVYGNAFAAQQVQFTLSRRTRH